MMPTQTTVRRSPFTRNLSLMLAVAGLCGMTPTPVRAQITEWSQRAVSGPSPRFGSAMAYDSARGVTVLFGGYDGSVGTAVTWEWNGTAWTQRVVSGPSPRRLHTMAYDSARGVTVLFGGYNDNGTLNAETWEWNGTAWTQWVVSGPSPRYVHAMGYDSARGETVLFGGYIGTTGFTGNNQTWVWNGTAWTQRVVGGPSPRGYLGGMAYDSARSVSVLFGGWIGSNNNSRDTWEWNGSAWTRPSLIGPSPRRSHATVYDSARGVTVLFGGDTGSGLSGETWEWNGTAWTQRVVSGPSPRYFHAMAYDVSRGVTVLFGGDTGSGLSGETWELCALDIRAQPAPQFTCPTGSAILALTAGGTGSLIYQWQGEVNQLPGTWLDISDGPLAGVGTFSGATTASMTISNVTSNAAGNYRCIVSNTCGIVNSNPAYLTVVVGGYANCDQSTLPPILNVNDFVCFLTRYAASDPWANCDGSTVPPLLNVNDFICFQQKYAAGCP